MKAGFRFIRDNGQITMRIIYFLPALFASLPLASYAESYTIDAEHSVVRFSVSHFLFLTTHGSFSKTSGKITLNRADGNGSVDIVIAADSINTDHAKRDENLRSENFFSTTKYPLMTYQSSAIQFINDTPAIVEGNLTLLGVNKPVMLTISSFKCGTDSADKQERCNATARTQIKRSDFGMTYALPLIGDVINLTFEVAAFRVQ